MLSSLAVVATCLLTTSSSSKVVSARIPSSSIVESSSYYSPPTQRKRRRKNTSITNDDNDNKWSSIINSNKRNATIRTLQYGGYASGGGSHHPFEAYSHDRLLQSTTTTVGNGNADIVVGGTSVYFEDNRYSPTLAPTALPRPMSTSSPTTAIDNPALYEPIRMIVDASKLTPYIELDPTRYSYLVDYLNSTAGPAAAQFWSAHLSTIPVTDSITITKDDCPLLWNNNDDDETTIYTFTNADLIIYLLIDDGPCLSANPPIAFSSDCLSDQFDRPIVGTVLLCTLGNFDDFTIDNVISTDQQRQKIDEVLQHEFAHILGMSGSTAPYWRNVLEGGAPYTARPLVEQNVTCLDGTIESIYLPSTTTMITGVTARGIKHYEIVTPTVRNVVANQFDCWTPPDDDRIMGARLDTNDGNCIGSHWSTRFFATETMVSRDMSWKQSVTALTLALMEDTGWYKANYDASSGVQFPSAYGYGRGCAFLTDDCIIDGGAVPQTGLEIFCNTTTTSTYDVRCDASHQRAAKCDLVDYDIYDLDPIYPYLDNIPNLPGAQYQARFGGSNLGSFLRFDAEYCPTYTAPPSFVTDVNGIKTSPMYMECSNSDTAPIDVYDFESFGIDGSTCINTIGAITRPLCLQIECVAYSGVVVVVVTIGLDGETITCEEDGQVIDIMTGLQIVCPQREVLCPGYYCPANCAGRGVCRHGQVDGCECFDADDTSPHCANSPIVPPTIMPTILTETSTPTTMIENDGIMPDIQYTQTPAVATILDGGAYSSVYDEDENSITIIIGSPTVSMTAGGAAVSFTLQHVVFLIMLPSLLTWM